MSSKKKNARHQQLLRERRKAKRKVRAGKRYARQIAEAHQEARRSRQPERALLKQSPEKALECLVGTELASEMFRHGRRWGRE